MQMGTLVRQMASTFLVVTSVWATALSIGSPAHGMQVKRLQPSPHQQQELREAGTIRDGYITHDYTVWLATADSAWLWDTAHVRLRRIPLPGLSAKNPVKFLDSDGYSILAAADHSLFQMFPTRQKVYSYEYPHAQTNQRPGRTLGLAHDRDRNFWIHSQGMVMLDRYGKKLLRLPEFPLDPSLTAVQFDPKKRVVWGLKTKREVMRIDLESRETKVMQRTRNTIKSTGLYGSSLVFHTAFSALRLGSTGKLLQRIPVDKQRRLVLMHLTPQVHSYLFNDRLLEVYDMQRRSVVRLELPLGRIRQAERLIVRPPMALLIGDGEPHVFSWDAQRLVQNTTTKQRKQ